MTYSGAALSPPQLLDRARQRTPYIPRKHPRLPQLSPHEFARESVEVDAERGGVERLDALVDQAGDRSGDDVAGAAGSEAGVGGGADPRAVAPPVLVRGGRGGGPRHAARGR